MPMMSIFPLCTPQNTRKRTTHMYHKQASRVSPRYLHVPANMTHNSSVCLQTRLSYTCMYMHMYMYIVVGVHIHTQVCQYIHSAKPIRFASCYMYIQHVHVHEHTVTVDCRKANTVFLGRARHVHYIWALVHTHTYKCWLFTATRSDRSLICTQQSTPTYTKSILRQNCCSSQISKRVLGRRKSMWLQLKHVDRAEYLSRTINTCRCFRFAWVYFTGEMAIFTVLWDAVQCCKQSAWQSLAS